MKPFGVKIIILGIGFLMLLACSSSTPHLDQNRGKAYEEARYSQLLNPEVEGVTDPVVGLDGRESVIIEDKYRETFKVKQPRPSYNINMPGVTSSGSGSSYK